MLQELVKEPSARSLKQDRNVAKDKIISEVTTVTPEIAKAWLDKNIKNRKIAAGTVSAYARDMRARKWLLTGDAVRFDTAGHRSDCQHRLRACVESGTPFPSLVIYRLDPAAQDQMDTNKPRRAHDMLTLHGFHNTNRLAAVARMVYALKHEAAHSRITKLTNSEVGAIVKKHPGLHRSISLVAGTTGASGSQLAFIHFIAAMILDKEKRADAFLEVWRTGKPDYEGDPVHRLRERLLRQKTAREQLHRESTIRLMIHAWNLFAKRKPVGERLTGSDEVEFDGLDRKKL